MEHSGKGTQIVSLAASSGQVVVESGSSGPKISASGSSFELGSGGLQLTGKEHKVKRP